MGLASVVGETNNNNNIYILNASLIPPSKAKKARAKRAILFNEVLVTS